MPGENSNIKVLPDGKRPPWSQPQSGEHAWHALALLVLLVRELEGVRLCDKAAQRNSGRQRNPNNPVRERDTLPQLCPGCHWLMINPMV